MNDNRSAIFELAANILSISPDTDEARLVTRIEEVIGNYDVNKRNSEEMREDLKANIEYFLAAMKLEGLSPATLYSYRTNLYQFQSFVNKPTARVSTGDVREFLSSNPSLMSSTVGNKLSSIKNFYSWLVAEEVVLKNPAAKIRSPKSPQRLPKALDLTELERLRAACIDTRDRALLECLYSTACRASEITSIKVADIDWYANSAKVVGKGNKQRVVFFNARAMYYLNLYIDYRNYEENESEFLFTSLNRPYTKLTNAGLQLIIKNLWKRSGVTKVVTPHVIRHTTATIAIENGIELGDLQQLLGHSDPSTTLIYVKVSEERKRIAHKRFVT